MSAHLDPERVPLTAGVAAGLGPTLGSPRDAPNASTFSAPSERATGPRRVPASSFAASTLALFALAGVAAVALFSARGFPLLGAASPRAPDTCAERVRSATRDATFYAADVFHWTPFGAPGGNDLHRDPADGDILRAKTTTAQFMYPTWLVPPLRADPRRVGRPEDADLIVLTDDLVDVSPFIAKFAWHASHPEETEGSWARLEKWWRDDADGEKQGRVLVREAKRRLKLLKRRAEATATRQSRPRWAYLLPSEWMFTKDDLAEELRLGSAFAEALGDDAMAAVTDFDDLGPSLSDVVATVPFATHTAVAEALLAAGGVVDYAAKRRRTFFKGTGDRGAEGALGRQTDARTALRALEGAKGHAVFVSSDSMSEEALRRGSRRAPSYEEGMLASTYCWVPRGDNPTSRRIFDAVAAGCIPVVVSDDIARYLPFRWAVDWRAMILQVPEAVFAANPVEVADAVLALPDALVETLRARMDAARFKILWNDRADPATACEEEALKAGGRGKEARCSEAPRLYLDEMLYRAKTGIEDPDAALCEEGPRGDPRWNDGRAWNAEGTCPPWLAAEKLC